MTLPGKCFLEQVWQPREAIAGQGQVAEAGFKVEEAEVAALVQEVGLKIEMWQASMVTDEIVVVGGIFKYKWLKLRIIETFMRGGGCFTSLEV